MANKTVSQASAVLTKRAIILGGLVVLIFGVSAAVALFLAYPPRDSRSAVEIIRTAGTIAVGTGGAAGLLLAARRQQKTEEANADARYDAEERRISDLQASAGEQLGSEKAAVRLNGLYQLERLGQNYPKHRQTVASVICAYLRMPFSELSSTNTVSENLLLPSWKNLEGQQGKLEEVQVRLTAQKILADHLTSGTKGVTSENFWENIDVDLTGATLVNFDFSRVVVRNGTFQFATFLGPARFRQTQFQGIANFNDARFLGQAWFNGASFERLAEFSAEFVKLTSFDRTDFKGEASFGFSVFREAVGFSGSFFRDATWFGDTEIGKIISFDGARRLWDDKVDHDVWPPGWSILEPNPADQRYAENDTRVWAHVAKIE